MKWISVKDRLPKDGQIVIVGRTDQKETIMAKFYSLANQFIYDNHNTKPTHWQPRLAPPKQD